jgi:hypothetical protein
VEEEEKGEKREIKIKRERKSKAEWRREGKRQEEKWQEGK